MATYSAQSKFCRPEEDPFLLLESTLRSIEVVLSSELESKRHALAKEPQEQKALARPGAYPGFFTLVVWCGSGSAVVPRRIEAIAFARKLQGSPGCQLVAGPWQWAWQMPVSAQRDANE